MHASRRADAASAPNGPGNPRPSGDAVGWLPVDRRLDYELFVALARECGATTISAAAELAGVNRSTIYRLRDGEFKPTHSAVKMAARLGAHLGRVVDLDELCPVVADDSEAA